MTSRERRDDKKRAELLSTHKEFPSGYSKYCLGLE